MHLIYARFFMKALNDLGLVGFREPFMRLFSNGWVQLEGTKMSKSKGNVIGPDALIEAYGADPVRLYIMFIGPADEDMEWTDDGIEGMHALRPPPLSARRRRSPSVRRPGGAAANDLLRKAHATIAKVTDDIGRRQSFNTPIAAVMELTNEHSKAGPEHPAARFAAETAVSLIQPYAPHIAEELWERLGREKLWAVPWPVADESMLQRDTVELVLQVNGKVRDRNQVPAGLPEAELIALAHASEKVRAHLDGKEPRAFVVPDKLVNLVV